MPRPGPSRPVFADAVRFFARLERDNTSEFWTAHQAHYADAVRAPFVAVLDGVVSFGPWRVYRPHNDRRFRADAAPYKTFVGAVAERPDGVGAFVQVSRAGLLVGTGVPMPARDQLARLRAAVADDDTGPALLAAIDDATRSGATVHGGRWAPLARVPAGHPRDHRRAEQLRWKGVEANVRVAAPPWTTVEDAATAVSERLARPAALHAWLGRHVGPSALSPEERFAPKRR